MEAALVVVPSRQKIGLVCSCLDVLLFAVEEFVALAKGIGEVTKLFGEFPLGLLLFFPTTEAGVFQDENAGNKADDENPIKANANTTPPTELETRV